MKAIVTSALLAVGCLSMPGWAAQPAEAAPQNIILMIGDGMGNAATTAYRYMQMQQGASSTVFDAMRVGAATTYPDDDTWVTDSAAAATAMASGSKTANRHIGVTAQQAPLTSVLALAKQAGYATALVTTVPLAHATPAAFFAHNAERGNMAAIADEFVDSRVNGTLAVDLALAGGRGDFRRPDRDLLAELQGLGYQTLTQLSALEHLSTLPAIGLFSDGGLPHVIDAPEAEKQRLQMMTRAALRTLSAQPQPFFIMIEGGQIDWCGHANDIACLMAEMDDFAQAVAVAAQFTQQHQNTLLLVTADHSTGGLSVGAGDEKLWLAERVAKISSSVELLSNRLLYAAPAAVEPLWQQSTGFALDAEQRAALIDIQQGDGLERDLDAEMRAQVRDIINQYTYTGWTTLSHTADDVPVFARGPGAAAFAGQIDNTDIGRHLAAFIETASAQ